MKLDRVIFSSDLNSNYIQFWPLTWRIWKHVTGARPTLFFIAPANTVIEKSPDCDIIYVPQQNGLPTCFIAQCIRLLAPLWFPNDVCVISDVDLFMLSKTFFTSRIQRFPQTDLVVLNRYTPKVKRNSLCYHIGLGSTFAKLFNLPPRAPTWQTVFEMLGRWHGMKKGAWATDETIMNDRVRAYRQRGGKIQMQHTPDMWGTGSKLCLSHYQGFKFDATMLNRYIEMEPPFPYVAHKGIIDGILARVPSLKDLPLTNIPLQQRGVTRPNRHPMKNKMRARNVARGPGLRRSIPRLPVRTMAPAQTNPLVKSVTPQLIPIGSTARNIRLTKIHRRVTKIRRI